MSMGILTWIVLGLVAGWLAGTLMRGGYGLLSDVVLGIVGSIVGGYVGGLIPGSRRVDCDFAYVRGTTPRADEVM